MRKGGGECSRWWGGGGGRDREIIEKRKECEELHSLFLCAAMCRYVVLVSGLNLGSSWCDQLSVEMFVDYITGQLGGPAVRLKQVISVRHL